MKSSYTFLLWLSHVCCMHLELCICSGFETARSLALHGCTVVFACRDITRTQAAIDRIKEERAHAVCDVIELDLARLHSVTKFAATMKLRYKWALPILTISNICVVIFTIYHSKTHWDIAIICILYEETEGILSEWVSEERFCFFSERNFKTSH